MIATISARVVRELDFYNIHCVLVLRLSCSHVEKTKSLTLEQRVGVLKEADKGISCHAMALELGVGKTQIQTIRKEIIKKWESGACSDSKYSKPRKAGYEDLDKIVFEWFTIARAKNILVSGRTVHEKAKMYAEELGHSNFCASNGWFEKWLKRHNIRLATLSGEAADVDSTVVDD